MLSLIVLGRRAGPRRAIQLIPERDLVPTSGNKYSSPTTGL